jgi:hypothetical protein
MSFLSDLLGIFQVQDEGVDLPTRHQLNFIGSGVTVTDNPTTDTTDVTIPGGGGGGGDLSGPVSATDNAIARFDGASGDVVQDSLVTVDDLGNIALPATRTVDGRDLSTDGANLDNHLASSSNPHGVTAEQAGAVPTGRAVNTGTGLSGGGALTSDLTINLVAATPSEIGGMSAADKTKLDSISGLALSSDPPQALGAADAGSVGEASDAGHVHPHGDQAGGTLHAEATTSVAGFMSGADKTKLNGVAPGATAVTISGSTPQPVGASGAAGETGNASDAGHVHAHGDQAGGTLHAEATTSVPGFLSAADKTKLNSIESGSTATPISSATPQAVGVTGSAGVTGEVSDAGHIHPHGAQTDGTLHAVATTSVAGFMSAVDKIDHDAITKGFRGLNVQVGTTYTPVLGDAGKLITQASASDITTTIPPNSSVAFPYDDASGGVSVLSFIQLGGGEITLAPGSGVTLNVAPGRALRSKGPNALIQAIKVGVNTWYVTGDLAEAFDTGQQFETLVATFSTTDADSPDFTAMTIGPNTVFGANQTLSIKVDGVVRADGVDSAGLEAPTYVATVYSDIPAIANSDASGNLSFVAESYKFFGTFGGDGPFSTSANGVFAISIDDSSGSLILVAHHPAALVGTARWSLKVSIHAYQTTAPADFS